MLQLGLYPPVCSGSLTLFLLLLRLHVQNLAAVAICLSDGWLCVKLI